MRPPTIAQLKQHSTNLKITSEQAMNLHVMEGVLRRLALSEEADALFALRGGVLMRQWCAPALRPAADLDFLALHDTLQTTLIQETFTAVCAITLNDGVVFEPSAAVGQTIWANTRWPGFRLCIPAQINDWNTILQIDFGHGDPMILPPTLLNYPPLWHSAPIPVLACRPEMGFGWKVHGLFEREDEGMRWRQKDLHDIYLMLKHAQMEHEHLPAAIEIAFTSRDTSLGAMERFFDGRFGMSRGSRRSWRALHRERGGQDVPEDLYAVINFVANSLRPMVEPLMPFEHSSLST